ncbi:MAG: biopolymer transporter ExbD [Pseudomonadota bacterium]
MANRSLSAPDEGFAALGRPRRRRSALASLTPLIDIVFILVIFFMLASSFIEWRALDLGAPVRAAAGEADDDATIVIVGPKTIRLDGQLVSTMSLERRLTEKSLSPRGLEVVYIKTEREVPLGRLTQVIDIVVLGGAEGVTLVR